MKKALTAALLAALILTGCAENPDSEIIARKDMDNLIGEAQQTDESKADISDLQQETRYLADTENEALRVKIHADAEMDVPDTDTLSLLRVAQRRFTQEDCDRVRAVFLGDAQLCDITQTMQIVPRVRLEESIAASRQSLEEEKAHFDSDPEYAAMMLQGMQDSGIADSIEEYLAQEQAEIDRLQEKYESAPVTIDYSAYPSDGTLERNADRIAAEADKNGFWHSYCRHITDGDTLWVCTEDAKSMMHVQNSDDFSNVIWFSKSPMGFSNLSAYIIELPDMETPGDIPKDADTIEGETCTLSQADAEQQAEAVLQRLGLSDFVCCESASLSFLSTINVLNATDGAEDTHTYARPCHVLRYVRAVGGVPIEQPSGTKESESGGLTEDYTVKLWPAEMIEFRINDSGIIQFQWNAPLEITETVVDSAAMKPFSEISSTFERMMPVTAAQEIPEARTEITIDRVTLSYSRISEKDSFDTGLVVPVWAFIGKRYTDTDDGYVFEKENFYGVQMALNAIDGSVIVEELGY